MEAKPDIPDPCNERPKRSSRKQPIAYDEEADEFLGHGRKKRVAPKRTARRNVSRPTRSNVNGCPDPLPKTGGSQAWPDKYKPSNSRRFVGNAAAISELRSWLSAWKERHVQWTLTRKSQQTETDSDDSAEALSNCLLLTGPPGVGKTSSVYFLAEELGYKVFEVHASSERTGRRILSELHEATQSHHVEGTRLPLGSPAASSAGSQPETPARKRGRPPKNPKVGPLQRLFQQASSKDPQPKAPVEQTSPKGSPEEYPKTTITSYFAVKTEEKKVSEGTVPPKETVGPKDSPKGTLLDYFGACARKVGDAQATRSAKPTPKRKCEPVSSNKTRRDVTSSSACDEDCEVVVVEVSSQACKSPMEDKQIIKSIKRHSSKLRGGDEDANVICISDDRQTTTTKSKDVDENHTTATRKRQRTKPPSPTSERKVASNDATKSNLTYSSSSVILFDDVDTIFPQDDGFWSAVDSVLSTTKKPVIFTTTRDIWQVRSKLPSCCPVLKFETPTPGEVVELLKEVCSLEDVSQPSSLEMEFLAQYHHCDVRRCLSELQLRTVLHLEKPEIPLSGVLALEDLPLGDRLQNILELDSCAEFVDAQLMYGKLGLDLAYLSLPDLLPFPVIRAKPEQPVAEENFAEKGSCVNALDVSWLSDRESGEESEIGQACGEAMETKNSTINVGPHAVVSKACLGQLADMFDSFSLVDSFMGCLRFGSTNKRPSERIHAWQDGAVSLIGEQTCGSTAFEVLTYIEACSVKLRADQLRLLVRETEVETSELDFVVTDLTPSLSNLYGAAESRRIFKTNRRHIVECTVPASAAINPSAVLDLLGALRLICVLEKRRMDSNSKRSRRFLHYLDSCSLFLSDSAVGSLCAGLS